MLHPISQYSVGTGIPLYANEARVEYRLCKDPCKSLAINERDYNGLVMPNGWYTDWASNRISFNYIDDKKLVSKVRGMESMQHRKMQSHCWELEIRRLVATERR